jgi:hypothetical protein
MHVLRSFHEHGKNPRTSKKFDETNKSNSESTCSRQLPWNIPIEPKPKLLEKPSIQMIAKYKSKKTHNDQAN